MKVMEACERSGRDFRLETLEEVRMMKWGFSTLDGVHSWVCPIDSWTCEFWRSRMRNHQRRYKLASDFSDPEKRREFHDHISSCETCLITCVMFS